MKGLKLVGFVLITTILLYVSCHNETESSLLERIDLFNIPYGVSDTAVNPASLQTGTLDIAMSEGIFTLLDGEGSKLITVSSFGDILFLKKTSIASPGSSVAVDPNQTVFITDRLTNSYDRVFDQQSSAYADYIIRRFNRSGEELQYLGQEGPGGTPFSRVLSLQIHSDSTLSVVSMSETVWLIHHFGKAGNLLSSIRFSEDALPIPGILADESESQDRRVHINLDKIHTSSIDSILNVYIKFDYYREYSRSEHSALSGIEYFGSWLFVVDSRSGRIYKSIEIQDSKNDGQIPEFVGIGENSLIFIINSNSMEGARTPLERVQLDILVLDTDGAVVINSPLDLPLETIEIPIIKVSEAGLVFALAKRNTDIMVFWWNLGNHIRRKR
jgi:hypothetical protein